MVKKQILIRDSISIIEALKKLDQTAEKVLFIVDNQNILLGALTDGDIRRYLLKGNSLEDSIERIYNKSPKYINKTEFSSEAAKKIFLKYKITLLPILDKNKKIVEIISWKSIFSKEESISKLTKHRIKLPVIIMAGGKGTRLDPFTKILPKPLIPIGEKPIIEMIMDKFFDNGMSDFYITINHKAKMIKAYFEEFRAKYKINFIEEDKPLGTAGGLKFLQEKIKGPFFVSNSDILIEADYSEILKYHKTHNNDITIVGCLKNFSIPYGICEIENGCNLIKIREKPEFNYLVNTGMYIINSDIIKIIPKNEFYHITQLIACVRSRDGKVGVFPISEQSWIDIGEWEKYKKALERLNL